MKRGRSLFVWGSFFSALVAAVLPTSVPAQGGLAPAKLLEPPTDSWPTYNGDYSGRRYSPLDLINDRNAAGLTLGWVARLDPGAAAQGGGGVSAAVVKGTPLVINGVMYVTIPDHVWALDARTGRELWHSTWESAGGWHIGNRGVGVWNDVVFVETPDCHLVALDIADGAELWRTQICDLQQFYYASVAPVIVKDHVIVGVSGDDLDIPGYLSSYDPRTGEMQWRWYTRPDADSPEAASWPSEDAMLHGGGMTWVPSTYDPELNLLYLGTGNPQPVIAGQGREGDNLYTESIVALDPDTGKLVWYFQVSPHDTHDWDGVQTPVLFDGEIGGEPRKLVAQASRNGWFFVLDRETGENLVTADFVGTNWTLGVTEDGRPIPNPAKEPQPDGALVTPDQYGAMNWPPPSFNPDTGLFYANASRAYSVYYLYDDGEKPEGWGGNDRGGDLIPMLQAIDYRTGEIRWSHRWQGAGRVRSGALSTAGNLLFVGDTGDNVVALDARDGAILWHAGLHAPMSNGPITYALDGIQYLVVGAGDSLYAFVMLSPQSAADSEEWISLFNGRDLDDWTVKIRKHPVGENYLNTFRVEDGLMTVSYDRYTSFDEQFGHIFYKQPFSHYRLRVEYRFTGDQALNAPDWAIRNSGAMLHSQPPETMPPDQDFPISIEFQLLGGLSDGNPRPTGNMCSPGTNIVYQGKFTETHCINSTSPTFDGDQWVTAEALVLGGDLIVHYINGEKVIEYGGTTFGGGVVSGHRPEMKPDGQPLTSGYISLQSEGHPVQFRRVELLNLKGCMDAKASNYKSYYVEPDADDCRY